MNKKGLTVLNDVIKNNKIDKIACIIGSKDKAVVNDYYDEIKNLCIKNKINFFDRLSKKKCLSDYSIAIGWRWLIKDVDNLIILHDSILPRYRGFAPLVNCLINGEKKIGVTALLANDEFDKGDILLQNVLDITYPIKISKAIDIISKEYSKIVLNLLDNFDQITPKPQSEEDATYSLWRDLKDYFIDWNWSSEKVKRFVDAVDYPYGGARTKINDTIIRINDVEIIKDVYIENRDVGKILFFKNNNPVVVCGNGLIQIIRMFDETGQPYQLNKFRIRFE